MRHTCCTCAIRRGSPPPYRGLGWTADGPDRDAAGPQGFRPFDDYLLKRIALACNGIEAIPEIDCATRYFASPSEISESTATARQDLRHAPTIGHGRRATV